MEKKYKVLMDGEVMDVDLTHDEAERIVGRYIDIDEEAGDEHSYMIKPQ